jgi:hypothetical protein
MNNSKFVKESGERAKFPTPICLDLFYFSVEEAFNHDVKFKEN